MLAVNRFYHRLHTIEQPLQDWGGSLLSLALRWFVGWQFFKSGWVKLSDWDSTLALFTQEYHVPVLPPEVAAVLGTAGELGFSSLLFVGLLSRPAALGLLFVNAMAVISYPQLWKFECPAAINDHMYWGILLLVLLMFGPGRAAVDAWLERRAA